MEVVFLQQRAGGHKNHGFGGGSPVFKQLSSARNLRHDINIGVHFKDTNVQKNLMDQATAQTRDLQTGSQQLYTVTESNVNVCKQKKKPSNQVVIRICCFWTGGPTLHNE